MEITFDATKLHRVPIRTVRANDWNPKLDATVEEIKIENSVKSNGQRLPIVVRERSEAVDGTTVVFYEIIDGEQRYKACQKLGFQEVLVYNEGQLEDDAAKALTIWYQQQVPFDKLLETQLALSIAHLPLPYSPEELEQMRSLVSFDWEQVEPDAVTAVEMRVFTVRLFADVYNTVMRAINTAREAHNYTTEQALEEICQQYLNATANADTYLEA